MKFFNLILLLIVVYSSEILAQEWKFMSNENDITLERLETNSPKIYSLRATTKINTSVKNLKLSIENVENYPKWLYRYKFAEVIKKLPDGFILRAIIEAPTPFRSRKIQLQVTRKKEGNTVWYFLKNMAVSDSSFCPRCKEVSVMEGNWKLTPINESLSEIQNTMKMEINLPLPKNLIYPLMYKGPTNSFENLKKRYATKVP